MNLFCEVEAEAKRPIAGDRREGGVALVPERRKARHKVEVN